MQGTKVWPVFDVDTLVVDIMREREERDAISQVLHY